MNRGQFAGLLWRTYSNWQKHDATLRAAALTFFTIMPLPSLALIAMAVLAQFYGQGQALQHLITQVSSFAGPSVANLFSELLVNARSPLTSLFGSFIAVGFAVLGAMGAFSVLQKSIDVIWEIKPVQRAKTSFMKQKLFPFALIVSMGIIVVAATTFSTVLFGAIVLVLNPILGGFTGLFLRVLEVLLSLGLGTLLFAIIFRELPETNVQWQDVWLAAALTGLIFTILNYLFGLYLSLFQVSTLAGTAGSLIVLFLWIFLTNLFILFGAQMSKIYAETYGSHPNKKGKLPPKPEIDRVEMKAELNIKINPKKDS
jgi:membrane protein